MTIDALPQGMIRAATKNGTDTHEGYMPGFGNDFETMLSKMPSLQTDLQQATSLLQVGRGAL